MPSISSYFAQIDAMQWTPYMDECLDTLSENQESSFDELFINQVRLQLLCQQVPQALSQDRESGHAEGTIVPPTFYLKALQSNLKELKGSFCPDLLQDSKSSLVMPTTQRKISLITIRGASCIFTLHGTKHP